MSAPAPPPRPTRAALALASGLACALALPAAAQLGPGPTPSTGPGPVSGARGAPTRGQPGGAVAAPCSWISTAPTPTPRIEGPSVVHDGELYVFGGFEDPGLNITARVDAFDPAKGAWRHVTGMPTPVTHAVVALHDGRVWVVGGFAGDHPGPVTDEVWIYDIAADSWSPGPSLPEPRGSLGGGVVGNWLHVFGGVSTNKEVDREEHWALRLNSPTPSWGPAAPMPVPRNHLTAAVVDGLIYAVGGQNGHDVDPVDLPWVHAYDRADNSWTEVAPLPFPRSHVEPGTFVYEGRLVIAGGRANTLGQPSLSNVSAYDPQADAWTELLPLPAARIAPFAKVVGDTLVVGGGGPNPTQPVSDVHLRDASLPLTAVQRINAGGQALLAVASGDPLASLPASAWFCGDVWSTQGKAYTPAVPFDIAGTHDDLLYLTERTGPDDDTDELTYAIPVHGGPLLVRLHFAEIYWGAPNGGGGGNGKRVFDVFAEDVLVLDDLDIHAEVGPAAALVESFMVEVKDGVLDLRFNASKDRPKVSAIEVLPLGP